VADNEASDPMTLGIREFNNRVKADKRVEKVIIPVRDGLMLIRKL
jgi:predicted O-methyltransferase YrrM